MFIKKYKCVNLEFLKIDKGVGYYFNHYLKEEGGRL